MTDKEMMLGAELIGTVVGVVGEHLKRNAEPSWKVLERGLLNIVEREIEKRNKAISLMRQALRNSEEKLKLYRAQHSGEYIGGLEYSFLMEQIKSALAAVEQILENKGEA